MLCGCPHELVWVFLLVLYVGMCLCLCVCMCFIVVVYICVPSLALRNPTPLCVPCSFTEYLFELRSACYRYFQRGGKAVSGPVGLLSV